MPQCQVQGPWGEGKPAAWIREVVKGIHWRRYLHGRFDSAELVVPTPTLITNFCHVLLRPNSDEPQPEDHVERSLLRQCLENAMATELSP